MCTYTTTNADSLSGLNEHEGVKECFGLSECVCTSFKTKCISIFAHYVHVQQIPLNKNGDNSSSKNNSNDDNDDQNDFAKHKNRMKATNVIFALSMLSSDSLFFVVGLLSSFIILRIKS